MIRIVLAAACAWATVAAAPGQAKAQAQTWPERNVRLILPFGAGSATDIAARLMSDKLTAKWGKTIVIENRPGADGLVAINAFLSANDDHVLLYASSASFMAHPYTQEKLPYVLERDLAPIAQVADTVLSVGAPTASGIKTIAEFVARGRAEPDKVNAAGAAGVPEFVLMSFLKEQNLGVAKVPYRDVVQAGRDLAEGRIHLLLSSYAIVRPHLEAGKVTVLAVGSRERSAVLPNTPTVFEAGFPKLVTETTSGFYGPRTMPQALRERIGADIVQVLADAPVKDKITATGQDVRPGGPAAMAATLKRQSDVIAEVAKSLGMARKN